MDFSNFLLMQHEIGLIAVFLILFFCDVVGSKDKKWFYPLACVLFAGLTVVSFFLKPQGEAFGGMFVATEMTGFMKSLLNAATFMVFLQTYKWLNSKEVRDKR